MLVCRRLLVLCAVAAIGACASFHEAGGGDGASDGRATAVEGGNPAPRDAASDVSARRDVSTPERDAPSDSTLGDRSTPDAHIDVDHPIDAFSVVDARVDAAGCDAGGCPVEVVLDGLTQATVVVVDSDNVYVSDPGTELGNVYQCAKTGCTTPIDLGQGQASGIVVTAGVVYWSDSTVGDIVSCAVGGCGGSASSVVPGQSHADGLGFDGTRFYWSAGGAVVMTPTLAGGTLVTLATGLGNGVSPIASSGGAAYWLSALELRACAFTGCGSSAHTVTPAVGGSVVAWGGDLFFVNNNAVVTCPASVTSCNPFTVGATSAPTGLASDGAFVYWLDQEENGVFRCPVLGCQEGVQMFATSQESAEGAAIALDDDYVYWTDTTQVLRKHK